MRVCGTGTRGGTIKLTNENFNAKIPVVGNFEKVSFAQFKKSLEEFDLDDSEVFELWEAIELPKRATAGSGGHDFKCPIGIYVPGNGDSVLIPTGIRAKIIPGWVLEIYPRSSMGFKHGLTLDNTTGIIDADYYYADNEGHIMLKLHKRADGTPLVIARGERIVQGIFKPFGITSDDDATAAREGGMGSTGTN